MTSIQALKEQADYLSNLMVDLSHNPSLNDKLLVLKNEALTSEFLNSDSIINSFFSELSVFEQYVVCSVAVIGQAPVIFQAPDHLSDTEVRFKQLLDQLLLIEKFYKDIGGIIGYHYQIVHFLFEKESKTLKERTFHRAEGIDITAQDQPVQKAVIDGLRHLPEMGELYPIGGAGDRLDLKDEKTGLPLPTAKLMFLGRSLLTGLIRDLQAREFLYYKLFHKQLTTPIAMMTSEAKNNHQFVHRICEDNGWYYRPKNTFFAFMQPLAPVLTVDGNWSLKAPLQLFLKPSGHGVLWKVAQEKGVFRWFKNFEREKILIRQINNPIAGVDNGLLALIGIGCENHKAFGFASCHRLVDSAEGVNILAEKEENGLFHYSISNIEYTDFEKNNIQDVPENDQSPYSIYPSNTNILFCDINEIEKAIHKNPIPGMLINMKSKVPSLQEDGKTKEVFGGRLESTMQNIADDLTDSFDKSIDPTQTQNLRTFLTYNERKKTISVTKKSYEPGKSLNETPEGCYFDLLENNRKLLESCHFTVPSQDVPETFMEKGPHLHFIYHPALGPIYSVIQQKLRGGQIEENSELQLEIVVLDIENLTLNGSLLIHSDQPLGHINSEGLLEFSNKGGACTLINVQVNNKGIDRSKENAYCKNRIERLESLDIKLEQNSEFYAKDVLFEGSHQIVVPKNTKMVATMQEGQVHFESTPIQEPSWKWRYSLTLDHQITLRKAY